jgi:hypothetical protein
MHSCECGTNLMLTSSPSLHLPHCTLHLPAPFICEPFRWGLYFSSIPSQVYQILHRKIRTQKPSEHPAVTPVSPSLLLWGTLCQSCIYLFFRIQDKSRHPVPTFVSHFWFLPHALVWCSLGSHSTLAQRHEKSFYSLPILHI